MDVPSLCDVIASNFFIPDLYLCGFKKRSSSIQSSVHERAIRNHAIRNLRIKCQKFWGTLTNCPKIPVEPLNLMSYFITADNGELGSHFYSLQSKLLTLCVFHVAMFLR